MMGSLYSGVSGMKVHQVKMDVIGNNIANVNTVGFKKSSVNFAESMYRTTEGARAPQSGMGGTNPVQIGLGTQVSNITTNFTTGVPQSTGRESDMRIDGSGFFVVSNGKSQFYTRSGNFDLDKSGALVTSEGLKVQGWPSTKNADGTSSITAGTGLGDLTIPIGDVLPGKATSSVGFKGNLDQRAGIPDIKMSVDDGTGTGDKVDVTIKFKYDVTNDKWTWNATGATGSTIAGHGAFKIGSDGKISEVIDSETTPITNGGVTVVRSPLTGDIKFSDATNATNSSTATYSANQKIVSNNVYDSLGTANSFNMEYTKIDQNVWAWNASVGGNMDVTNGKGFVTFDSSGQIAGNYVFASADAADPTKLGTYTLGDGTTANTYPTAAQLGISNDPSLYASYLQEGADPASSTSAYKIDSNGVITYRGVKDSSGTALAQDEYGNPIDLPTLTPIPEHGEVMNVKYTGQIAFDPAGSGGALPPSAGANKVTISPSFSEVTQFSSTTSVVFSSQDGYGMGELESYKIADTGDIVGYYSNGYKQTLGKIAVASFSNASGLEKVGGSLFNKTPNSGEAMILEAGTAGTGGIVSQSLEMSNVDLAEEMTDMIVAQRGFQANSKTITTASEMLQDVINLKR